MNPLLTTEEIADDKPLSVGTESMDGSSPHLL
jgi:hypothetical protein